LGGRSKNGFFSRKTERTVQDRNLETDGGLLKERQKPASLFFETLEYG
jgi:hypothetical protein